MAKTAKKDILTEPELEFISLIFSGESRVKAYMDAFKTDNYNAAGVAAYELIRKPKIDAEISRMEAHGKRRGTIRLSCMLDKAFDVMEQLLDYSTPLDGVKLRTALAVLDRSGFPAKAQTEHSGRIDTGISFVLPDGMTEDDI